LSGFLFTYFFFDATVDNILTMAEKMVTHLLSYNGSFLAFGELADVLG